MKTLQRVSQLRPDGACSERAEIEKMRARKKSRICVPTRRPDGRMLGECQSHRKGGWLRHDRGKSPYHLRKGPFHKRNNGKPKNMCLTRIFLSYFGHRSVLRMGRGRVPRNKCKNKLLSCALCFLCRTYSRGAGSPPQAGDALPLRK